MPRSNAAHGPVNWRPWGNLCAFLAGVAASFGFAPYEYRLALAAGLIVFFLTLYAPPARTVAFRGLLFGLGYFGLGTYWVYHSIYAFADTPLWLASLLVVLLVFYLSLYPMLSTWMAAYIWPQGFKRLTGAAALFAAAEWVRGTVLSGFPWVLVGQGSLDSPWASYLPVLGVYATGLIFLLSAAWAAAWLRRPFSLRILALAAVVSIAAGGDLLRSVSWSTPVGAPVEVALIQPNLSQDLRWRAEHLTEIKQTYRELTEQVAETPLVIWPEAAIPLYFDNITSYYQDLTDQVLGADTTLLAGAFYRQSEQSPARNGLINIQTGQRYGKRRLVPFGEYTPLQDWLAPLHEQMNIPMRSMEPSEDRPLLQVRGTPAGVSICYESIYPSTIRQALPEAAYLINISNDAWFGDTRGPWQHLEASRVRAAETSRELLRVASTGVTAILRENGAVRAAAPQFMQTILEGEVQPREGATPYVRFGEWGFVALLILLLLFCFHRKAPAVPKVEAKEPAKPS